MIKCFIINTKSTSNCGNGSRNNLYLKLSDTNINMLFGNNLNYYLMYKY